MADPDQPPDNLVLVHLRRIDGRVERLGEDMREIKQRLGHLEEQYASISRRADNQFPAGARGTTP